MNNPRTKAAVRRELKDTLRRIENHSDKIRKLKTKEMSLYDELRNLE